jgi:hypothetical protein
MLKEATSAHAPDAAACPPGDAPDRRHGGAENGSAKPKTTSK